ncbi:hypothetical protein B5X24_HaOG215252 [Helicoverpa armigera]|nr:hypothetical protein B5X24_HaOG215252 [Helicoverpa armigera]
MGCYYRLLLRIIYARGGRTTESSRLSSQPLRWTWKIPRTSDFERLLAPVGVGVGGEFRVALSSSLRLFGDKRPVSAASVVQCLPQRVSKNTSGAHNGQNLPGCGIVRNIYIPWPWYIKGLRRNMMGFSQ